MSKGLDAMKYMYQIDFLRDIQISQRPHEIQTYWQPSWITNLSSSVKLLIRTTFNNRLSQGTEKNKNFS